MPCGAAELPVKTPLLVPYGIMHSCVITYSPQASPSCYMWLLYSCIIFHTALVRVYYIVTEKNVLWNWLWIMFMYVILHAVFKRQKNELARYQNLKLGHQNGIIMFISNLLLDASDIEALQTILRCNRDLSYARIYPHPHTTCSSKVQVHVTLAMLCFIRQRSVFR